jgi:hypothetical protein
MADDFEYETPVIETREEVAGLLDGDRNGT